MFFGRIYNRGKPFKASWRSYAGYAAIVGLILLAIEYNVLNLLPGNKMGNVLVVVPAFYLVLSVVFFVSDALVAAWRWYKGRGRARRRKKRDAARAQP